MALNIAESYWRKAIVTGCVAVALVFFYQVTAFDSRSEAGNAMRAQAMSFPQAGARLKFTATAYCKGETTASGVGVRTGIVAADPPLTKIGTFTKDTALIVDRSGREEQLPRGYEHFGTGNL